jgi:hypothetical protein
MGPSQPQRATVLLNGATYEYDSAAGKNIGSYVDPAGRFTMTCVRVTRSDCPVRVDFRAIPGWSCAIFEYGDAFSIKPNLPPYSVTIAGRTIRLPGHWWGSRWRWQSGVWPLPAVPVGDLISRKLLLAFDPAVTQGTARPSGSATYTPLGLAGISAYMPMTGEREEIGYVTGAQADYICEPTPQRLANVLAQGEAMATVPWRFFDPDTGTTIDAVTKYPNSALGEGNPVVSREPSANFDLAVSGPAHTTIPGGAAFTMRSSNGTINQSCRFSTGGTMPANGLLTLNAWEEGRASIDPTGFTFTGLPAGITATLVSGSFRASSGIYTDAAHEPAGSYLPFLLTGDPYFLENLHCQVMYAFLEARGYANAWFPGAIQVRSMAWNLRSIYQAAAVTPAQTPPWLMPKAAMEAALEYCRRGITQAITVPGPTKQSVFHTANISGQILFASWQEDFFDLVLAATVLLHPEWMPVLQFFIQCPIAMLNGTSGWCNGSPDTYDMKISDPNGKLLTSWAAAWAASNGGSAACPALSTAGPPKGQMDYLNGRRAALSAATQALATGDPLRSQVEGCLNYLVPFIQAWLSRGQGCEYKWAIKRIG